MESKRILLINVNEKHIKKKINLRIFNYAERTSTNIGLTKEEYDEVKKERELSQYLERLKIIEDSDCNFDMNSDKDLMHFIEEKNFEEEFILNENYNQFNDFMIRLKLLDIKGLNKEVKNNKKLIKDIEKIFKIGIYCGMPRRKIQDSLGNDFGFENKEDQKKRIKKLEKGIFNFEMHFKYNDSKQHRMYFGFVDEIKECKKNCVKCSKKDFCDLCEEETNILIYHIGKHL